MNDKPLVFLDIETTGMSPPYARITEIGAIRVMHGKITATFSQLINPETPVPWQITKLTGITDDMLWDAPLFQAIADELEVFLEDAIFVAHNVNFDHSFIKSEYGRLGTRFEKDRFCTARLSRRLYPAQSRHNLDTIIQTHNIAVKNRHRALDDAKALFEFYKHALSEHQTKVHNEIDRLLIKAAPTLL
jgi:DNA polymerase-3 subunit epsilon